MHSPKKLLPLVFAACFSVYAEGTRTNQAPASVSSDIDVGVLITTLSPDRPIIVGIERHKYPDDPWFFQDAGGTPEIPKSLALQWQTNYAFFSKSLVLAAEKAKLDSSSLAKILETVRGAKENRGLAILPVAAHATKVNGELVWVVSLRWEGEKWVMEEGDMIHIRSFTITQKTLKQVDFSTCD
jgi:hypothetical protein